MTEVHDQTEWSSFDGRIETGEGQDHVAGCMAVCSRGKGQPQQSTHVELLKYEMEGRNCWPFSKKILNFMHHHMDNQRSLSCMKYY